MRRIELHSRVGNLTLAAIGVLYFAIAVGLFAFFVISTWGAASALDRFLQLSLLGSAIGGAFLFTIGAKQLSLRLPRPGAFRAPRRRQASAAARS